MSIYIGDLGKDYQKLEKGIWVPAKMKNWDFRTWKELFRDLFLVIRKRGYVIVWDKKYK
jgi:hypothetical protein